MTALDLVRIMRANLKLLVLAALIGTLLAAGYTLTRPTLYSASSTAQVIAGNSIDANSAVLSQQLSTGRAGYYAQLASSSGVANRIAEESKGSLRAGEFSVVGASGEGSATLTLTASAATPAKAQRAADLARTALADEAKYLETVGTEAKTSVYRVFPLTAAARPSAPSSPNWMRNLMAGAAIGLLAGIVLVVLRKQLDSRIRHTSEVEKLTGSGVLGVIPKAPTLQSKRRGGLGELGTTAEAFRMLRTNLRYISTERPPRSLVITSAMQGEGKSTVAANLARVLSAAGQSVVLVDTDLRRPTVHETFELENLVGLTEVLTGQAPLASAIQQGDHKNLAVITSGRVPPNPSELLGSRRMSAVIEALGEEYFVVLDAPPLLPVTDAGLLAVAADGAAVVYQHGRTHREQVGLCAKILEQVGAHYYGSILNMTPPKQMGSTIYGYGAGNYGGATYGYGYGSSEDPSAATAPTPSPEVRDLTLTQGGSPAELPGKQDAARLQATARSAPAPARTTSGVRPLRGPAQQADVRDATPNEPARAQATGEPARPQLSSEVSTPQGQAPLTRRARRRSDQGE